MEDNNSPAVYFSSILFFSIYNIATNIDLVSADMSPKIKTVFFVTFTIAKLIWLRMPLQPVLPVKTWSA